jgi:epsilon-lactone hydrolase
MHPSFAIEMAKNNYLGSHGIKDPLVSPLFADFGPGFPPTVITTGTRDMLMSPSINLS